MTPRIYLNHISGLDWLIALEFGRVDDGQPSENWRGVSDSLGYLHDAPGGRVLGFKVVGFSDFDPDDDEVAEIWSGPRFDVPQLGLAGVCAGEILLSAPSLIGEGDTINRHFFNEACRASGDRAIGLWRRCLQSGDAMGHFGLGCALYEAEQFPEAYRHLRHYTEIAPAEAWNWRWYGSAAEAIGEVAEARAAYERALELDEEEVTDAAELLEELDA